MLLLFYDTVTDLFLFAYVLIFFFLILFFLAGNMFTKLRSQERKNEKVTGLSSLCHVI